MSKYQELRPRIERLLRADSFRVDDFTNIFLQLRFRAGDKELFREIGHFVSHMGDRERGLATAEMEDAYTITQFMLRRIGTVVGAPPEPYDFHRLPSDSKEFFLASVRQRGAEHVARECGLRRKQVNLAFKSLAKKFLLNEDGTLTIEKSLIPEESKVLWAIFRSMTFPKGFSGDRLFSEFCSVLIANKLMSEEERKLAQAFKPQLLLFTVQVLHNCQVRFSNDARGSLRAGSIRGEIDISACVPHPLLENVETTYAIFTTGLTAADHCEGPLLLAGQVDRTWDYAIELTPSGKLAIIGT